MHTDRITLCIVILITLAFVQCSLIENTLDGGIKPQPYPSGVTREILDLHRLLLKSQQEATIDTPRCYFAIRWTHPFLTDSVPAPSDSIDGYVFDRSRGLDAPFFNHIVIQNPYDTSFVDSTVQQGIRYRYTGRAYKIGAEGDTAYTAIDILLKLVPDNPPFYSDDWRDIMYGGLSDTISVMWVSVGDPVEYRDNIALYDTIWTSVDMLAVNIPLFNPYEIEWIKEPEEKVIWKGYDPNEDGQHSLSDLVYYGNQIYNRITVDTVMILP